MISLAISLCGPVERCLVIARWRVSVGWCRWASFGRTDSGRLCFCASAAVRYPFHSVAIEEAAMRVLREVIGTEFVVTWNDAPDRTQAEVVAAFDEAILLARARGV